MTGGAVSDNVIMAGCLPAFRQPDATLCQGYMCGERVVHAPNVPVNLQIVGNNAVSVSLIARPVEAAHAVRMRSHTVEELAADRAAQLNDTLCFLIFRHLPPVPF